MCIDIRCFMLGITTKIWTCYKTKPACNIHHGSMYATKENFLAIPGWSLFIHTLLINSCPTNLRSTKLKGCIIVLQVEKMTYPGKTRPVCSVIVRLFLAARISKDWPFGEPYLSLLTNRIQVPPIPVTPTHLANLTFIMSVWPFPLWFPSEVINRTYLGFFYPNSA